MKNYLPKIETLIKLCRETKPKGQSKHLPLKIPQLSRDGFFLDHQLLDLIESEKNKSKPLKEKLKPLKSKS